MVCMPALSFLPFLSLLRYWQFQEKAKTRPLSHTWAEITKAPGEWFLWSSVGFVLFYAPLTFGSTFGESWLAAATWQLTIVACDFINTFMG